jgi:hypothetical protein
MYHPSFTCILVFGTILCTVSPISTSDSLQSPPMQFLLNTFSLSTSNWLYLTPHHAVKIPRQKNIQEVSVLRVAAASRLEGLQPPLQFQPLNIFSFRASFDIPDTLSLLHLSVNSLQPLYRVSGKVDMESNHLRTKFAYWWMVTYAMWQGNNSGVLLRTAAEQQGNVKVWYAAKFYCLCKPFQRGKFMKYETPYYYKLQQYWYVPHV